MDENADVDGVSPELRRELRRQVFHRLALVRPDGTLILCNCSRTRERYGDRPKITYASYADARMAARALILLPGATPIRIYQCRTTPGQFHHSGVLSKGRKGRRHTLYPPNWVEPDD